MTEHKKLNLTTILTALDQAGFSKTRPRQAIAEQVAAWAAEGRDFTIEDLWHAAQQRAPGLGRATTFRTVEVLAELGLLDRVAFAAGPEHYHCVQPGSHHHHLTCERCHRVVEVNACVALDQFVQAAREAGFVLSSHRIELFGRCPECQDITHD
ncbi:MAG TPA: Fur family transcriptional regulator [Ktedonobacterales bacterium]|jgi:Fur family ferric uptake transcriptional regulator